MGIETYSTTPSSNVTLGALSVGPNMPRANARPAFQQLMADLATLKNSGGAANFGVAPLDAGGTVYNAQARMQLTKSFVADFGADPTGATSSVAALNRFIAWANTNGSINDSASKGICLNIEDGKFDLKAGGINPLLVSNVTISGSNSSILLVRDGRLFSVGNASNLVENFVVANVNFKCELPDVPDATQCCIWIVNAARVLCSDPRTFRVRRIMGCDLAAGAYCANAYVWRPTGHGMPDSNYMDFRNVSGGIMADIQCIGANCFAYSPPANPPIVPTFITSITQANPGVVTTSVAHGFTTGDKVRLRDVGGMTQVNGNDYTITVLTTTTFSIGANTTGFTAYSAGGYAAKLHWSNVYDAGFMKVEGVCDTIKLGGVVQHWRRFGWFKATGVISFVTMMANFEGDYLGHSLMKLDTSGGGTISEVRIEKGWSFTMDGPTIDIAGSTVGSIKGLFVSDLTVGLAGSGVIYDALGVVSNAQIRRLRTYGLHRLDTGAKYSILFGANADSVVLNDIKMLDPASNYGAGAATPLDPTVAIYTQGGGTNSEIVNCETRGSGQNIAVTIGTGKRTLYGNRCAAGQIPETHVNVTPTVTASPFAWKNNLGMPVLAKVSGGTVSDVSVTTSGANTSIATTTGGVHLVGREQTLTLTYTVAPTLTVLPVNV